MANGRRKPEAEEDKIIAGFIAAKNYAARYKTAIMLVAAAVLVVVVVSALVFNSRARAQKEAHTQIAEAVFMMQGMDYQRAALLLESLLERHPGGTLGRDIRYHLATAEYLSGNTSRALELFQQILAANPPDDMRRFNAKKGIADCYAAQGDFAQAAQEYEKIAPEAPEKEAIPFVLADAARCYEEAGDFQSVRRIADRLTAEFGKDNEQWKREGARLTARTNTLEEYGPEKADAP